MRTIVAGLVAGALMSACAPGATERGSVSTPSPSGGSIDCPVTVPPQPGFVPPEPFPPEPPSGDVWYGTSGLWTILEPHGAIGWGVPERDGGVADKTLWWSENFSTAEGADFVGPADISLTAVRLDGPAPMVIERGGTPSFNRDMGNFMLVGLALPKPGCWKLTARYRRVELTVVLRVP